MKNFEVGDIVRCVEGYNNGPYAGYGYRPNKIFKIYKITFDKDRGTQILWPPNQHGIYSDVCVIRDESWRECVLIFKFV